MVTEPDKLANRILSRIGGAYEYSLCIIDESMIDEKQEIIDEISALDSVPVIFAFAGSSEKIDILSRNKKVTQVLYKPIFQSVLLMQYWILSEK